MSHIRPAALSAVATITICEVLTQVYADSIPPTNDTERPPFWFDSPVYKGDDWAAQRQKIMAWCAQKNAHYYARGKEDFFEWEACEEAAKTGKSLVVLDNLS